MEHVMTDEELRAAIMDTHEPIAIAQRIFEYYHDNDRAREASRELMMVHLGMLTGAVMKLDAAMKGTK
jgi:hypothetical protein